MANYIQIPVAATPTPATATPSSRAASRATGNPITSAYEYVVNFLSSKSMGRTAACKTLKSRSKSSRGLVELAIVEASSTVADATSASASEETCKELENVATLAGYISPSCCRLDIEASSQKQDAAPLRLPIYILVIFDD
jgi:hypothetical protein